jgi:predicted peptidase
MRTFSRKLSSLVLAGTLAAASLAGCSSGSGAETSPSSEAGIVAESTQSTDSTTASGKNEPGGRQGAIGENFGGGGGGAALDKSSDLELQDMISAVSGSFTQDTYTDGNSGLSVPYNIYVPDGYAGDGTAPIIFFIGDATTAGNSMEYSLTQGWGGIVWASDAVQSKEKCIVVTLVFPEVILDDHDGYQLTDYVGLVPDIVTSVTEKYGADPDRIYGTGQSMGAMTTLYTAAQNPDLYAGVLIVDGQWDISTLKGIENVNFLYVTAGGDQSATDGQKEVKDMLKADGVAYSEVAGLDASLADSADTKSQLEDAVSAMLAEGNSHNFITWEAGSVLKRYGGTGMEHMASFDYGYKLASVRDWLLAQSK